jgi:hypothetical protein
LLPQLFSKERQKDLKIEASQDKVNESLTQKQNTNKRAGGVTQEEGCFLPSKCRGPQFNPQYCKQNKKQNPQGTKLCR